MNNKRFTEINNCELYDLEGGLFIEIVTVVGALAAVGGCIYTAYQSNKADAYDEGKKQAYEDMYK